MFGKGRIDRKAEVSYYVKKKGDKWILEVMEYGEVVGRSFPLPTLKEAFDTALSME